MTAPDLILYHFPGACSRVSVCALEMAGLPYALRLVNIATGEQSTPAYRAVSALGKVPALLVDGEPLLENSAILTLIDALAPDAGIFPRGSEPRLRAEGVGGMSFCGGTLHPLVRGILNPQRVTVGDGEGVRERSRELAAKAFAYADAHIAERGWWLHDVSIVDVYLDWVFGVARKGGFDAAAYPHLIGLESRLSSELPAYGRMLEIEDRSRTELGL